MTPDEQATALDFPAAGSVTGIAIRWWFGPQRAAVTREAAEEAIRRAAGAGHYPDAVGDADALERLVGALTDNLWAWTRHAEEGWLRWHARDLRDLGEDGTDWRQLAEELDAGGGFWLDELAAEWLGRSGAAGGLAAAKLRTEAQERADAYRVQEVLPLRDRPAVWALGTGERDEQGNEVVRLHEGPLDDLPEEERAGAWLVSRESAPRRPWSLRRGGPWPVFAAWLPKDGERVPVFGRWLATALWLDEVGPAWAAAREYSTRRAAPALPLQTAGNLAGLARLDKRRGSPTLHSSGRLEAAGRPVLVGPVTTAETAEYLTQAPALGGLTAQRFIRWAPVVVYEAAKARALHARAWTSPDEFVTADADGDGVRVEVLGGWRGLAEVVTGANTPAKRAEVKELLDVLWASELHDEEGGQRRRLLTESPVYRRGSKHSGPGRVVLRLPLQLWGGGGAVSATGVHRRLVPVLPVPALPPGLEVAHAGLAALDMLGMKRLALHADELLTRGGVALDWQRLSEEAGVKPKHGARALEEWQRGPTPRWACDGGLWRLAETDETAPARASLEELGRRVVRGREGGEKRAAKRRSEAAKRK